MTPEQRRLRARVGAYAQHAKYDTRETTAKARQIFLERFERQVDPDARLDPRERARRAEAARRAYFTSLALRSATARSRRVHGGIHALDGSPRDPK